MCISSQQCSAFHRDTIGGTVIFVITIQTLTIGILFEIPYLSGLFLDFISQTSKISKNKGPI